MWFSVHNLPFIYSFPFIYIFSPPVLIFSPHIIIRLRFPYTIKENNEQKQNLYNFQHVEGVTCLLIINSFFTISSVCPRSLPGLAFYMMWPNGKEKDTCQMREERETNTKKKRKCEKSEKKCLMCGRSKE